MFFTTTSLAIVDTIVLCLFLWTLICMLLCRISSRTRTYLSKGTWQHSGVTFWPQESTPSGSSLIKTYGLYGLPSKPLSVNLPPSGTSSHPKSRSKKQPNSSNHGQRPMSGKQCCTISVSQPNTLTISLFQHGDGGSLTNG